MPLTDSLTYLSPDLPGIGGVLKQRPEDFLVEEQPLYEPSGEGEHLYLYIEKRGLTTIEAVRRVAKYFRMNKRNIGYAGLKDKHAVTRQHLSLWVPQATNDDIAASMDRLKDDPKINALWAERHGNKLRRGHHGGNRFVLRVREVDPTAVVRAKPILDLLTKSGVPNYIGDQRFGYRQNSHRMGRLLLRGEYEAVLDELLGSDYPTESEFIRAGRGHYRAGRYTEALEVWPKVLRYDRQALDALRQGKRGRDAVRAIDPAQRRFLVSAWQSDVFNQVLDRRLRGGSFDRLLLGDLAWKHDNRSVFVVDDEAASQDNAPGGRVEGFEVSPSGPLWGVEMPRATGETGEIERAKLEASGITEDQLAGPPGDPEHAAEGRRRPLRIVMKDPDLSGGVDEHGAYVRVSFELPRGAYATMVMRELMKNGGEGTGAGD
ncbi:MAG: tRNA pseudouridine(13) synthase TruD [Planctomycetota bacterium]